MSTPSPKRKKPARKPVPRIERRLVRTGVKGLDDVLGGGLPADRVMLAVGGPGCGKSVLSMEFIYRGVTEFNEPGVYYSFEESVEDLYQNAAAFGWDLGGPVGEGRLFVGYFDVQPDVNIEVGEFNLEALFFRIDNALKSVRGKRLVLDGINNLLAGFANERIVRSEMMRLFRWLKAKDVTVLVTGERGVDTWSKLGFEEYLCDGLIVLKNSVSENFTTRHLRIVKCRSVDHGTDEYPFLIGHDGINIIPVLNADFDYKVVTNRYVGTGIAALDEMFGPKGYIKGSTVLVTGTSGTGKSSLAAAFVNAACERGEKAVYFAFEESADQVTRNMKSIGIDLDRWVRQGLLKIHAKRSTTTGLEGHLVALKSLVAEFEPSVAVIDPLTAFRPVASTNQIKLMLIRLNDYLRSRHVTTVLTSLSTGGNFDELSDIPMSSLADTWINLRILNENGNEQNNVIQILKSRGMAHVKQPKEYYFTSDGIILEDLYTGPDGMLLAGSGRIAQKLKDEEHDELVDDEIELLEAELKESRDAVDARVTVAQKEHQRREHELQKRIAELRKRKKFKQAVTDGVALKIETEGVGA